VLFAAAMAVVLAGLVAENVGAGPLNELLLHLPGVDKVLHFGQSLVIFALLHWALGRAPLRGPTRVLVAVAGTLGAAVFDEVQQQWGGDRHVELADIGAGVAGVMVAAAALSWSVRPRLATAVGLGGLALAGGLTYHSYLQTRDYNRGLLAERAGRRDEAREHYLRAVAASVDNPEVYNAAAWAIADSDDADAAQAVQAVHLAERSLAMRPGNADTLDTYGWSLYRAGRAADAVKPLEQAYQAKPDIYCIHYHLGMTYLALGRQDEGRTHLRRQVERMPRTREARLAADELARADDKSTAGR
jgi:tetratricopeptide (TPR) repeat protein